MICQIRPEAYVELFLKNRNIKDLRGIFLAPLERTLVACPGPRILKPFAAQLRSGFFHLSLIKASFIRVNEKSRSSYDERL